MQLYVKRDGFHFCGRVSEMQEFWRELEPLAQSGLSVKDFCKQQLQ